MNAILAAVACVVNLRALPHNSPTWRNVHVSIAALAAVYVGGYLYLAIWPENLLTWSQTMRGVSMLAWPVVWIIPAVVQRRSIRRTNQILEEERCG